MSHYVLAVPMAFDSGASWAPFADDTGMGYIGVSADGQQLRVMLRPVDDVLCLVVDGEIMTTYRVGEP